MFRYMMLAGLALFLPGLFALGYAVLEGPSAWMTDSRTFWGTPISLFVFWIGLAHAGTLLSAIFLALGIKLDRRTALIAELSTLVCLVFACIFPLMHLGVIENFYMVAPFLDARGNFSNVRSPLVWDFCCIVVYALLSLLFFTTHLKARAVPALDKYCKPMAWLLFPLVLWVHTVVSLDFATTFVPEWRGAFFPVYFIVGAILSGLALVNLLICAEGYRVRLMERLQLICSWILCAIWIWDLMFKGYFCTSAFIFAVLLPQFRMVAVIRESRPGRIFFSLSILLGLFLERYYLVSPLAGVPGEPGFGMVDLGLVAFSLGGFMMLFYAARSLLNESMEGGGTYFGEVDGSDMVNVEESEQFREKTHGLTLSYIQPWSSDEYRTLRLPLACGFAVALFFVLWVCDQLPFEGSPYENVEVLLVNALPLTYPVIALVAALVLACKAVWVDKAVELGRKFYVALAVVLVALAALAGAFYAGGAASRPDAVIAGASQYGSETLDSAHVQFVWNARCAQCHGVDGRFNEKFIREYYPVPQKLDAARIDSLGLDSLVNVVLDGRANMNPYRGRLTESEARALVAYMRSLAEVP